MSIPPRLYVTQDLNPEADFMLDEDQSKYVLRVMRLGLGDPVRVFNGRHGEWTARITSVEGKRAQLQPVTQTRQQPGASGAALMLLFAPVKKSETDIIVEKATELGAAIMHPVLTDRTQTRTIRKDRFEKIAREAAEQTERLDLPTITELTPLTKRLDEVFGARDIGGTASRPSQLFFCDEAGDEADRPWGGATGRGVSLPEALQAHKGQSGAILIGPEGGFSPEERAMLRGRDDTTAVSLGPRILRAETAAIAAMTLWQAHCGDW